jgi:hypothetical protein
MQCGKGEVVANVQREPGEDKIDKKGKIHYELNDYLLYQDGTMEKIKKVR